MLIIDKFSKSDLNLLFIKLDTKTPAHMELDITTQNLPFYILFYFLADSYICKNLDHGSV